MLKQTRLVRVEWMDSRQATGSWQFLNDAREANPCRCVSVGYLIYDANGVKRLAANLADVDDPDGIQVSGVITIPDCCIKEVADL